MILSYQKKFVFVHTYKTGGTSIRTALRPYRDRPGYVQIALSKLGFVDLATHSTAQEVKSQYPSEWNDYFTFAFVRNPWSWQVSLYFFTLENEYNHHHEVVKSLGSFKEYIQWRVDGNKQLLTDFVTDKDGNRIVDYVGRMETMQSDFQKICNHLDIDAKLPHKNKSSHHDYREYYDEETKQLVAKHFASDIERFGYCFEGIRKSTIN